MAPGQKVDKQEIYENREIVHLLSSCRVTSWWIKKNLVSTFCPAFVLVFFGWIQARYLGPSRAVEQQPTEQYVLNKAYCTKNHFHKYQLNINHLNKMPIEHQSSEQYANWTISQLIKDNLNIRILNIGTFEQFANWTIPNLTLHNSSWTINQLNIVKLNNKLGIWARPQGLTRF